MRIRGIEHRLWLKQSPVAEQAYAAELPFDEDFEIRAHAARRLCGYLPRGIPLLKRVLALPEQTVAETISPSRSTRPG